MRILEMSQVMALQEKVLLDKVLQDEALQEMKALEIAQENNCPEKME